MIEDSLDLLGPDIELLTEIMMDLGEKHERYGVKTFMYQSMGEGIVLTMEHFLSEGDFKQCHKQAWKTVYQALTDDMKDAQAKMQKK